MSAKGIRRTGLAGAAMAMALGGVALAAAPLPEAGKAYSDNVTLGKGKLSIALVISSSAKKIASGVPILGVPHSGGFLECPKAPHFSTGAPYVEFPFPGAKLKLSGGKYGFTVTETKTNPTFLGSSQKGKLKVTIKGTVGSSTLITGSVSASGDDCTTGAVSYRAKLLATTG